MPDAQSPAIEVVTISPRNGAGSAATLPAPGVIGEIKAPEVKPGEPAKAVEPAPDKTMSARYADLAKREKGITAERRKLSEERATIAKDRAEVEEYRKAKADAKRNPEAFQRLVYGEGWYDSLTKYKLEGTPPAELLAAAVDDKLEAFKAEQAKAAADSAKAASDAKAAEDAKAREEFASEVVDYVKANAEKYELIELYGSHDLVPQLIEAEHQKTGKLLSAVDAADKVEEFLASQASKALNSRKLKAQQQQPDKRNEPQQRRTLSNDMTVSAQAARPPPKSDDERFARAIAVMQEAERRKA